MRSCWHEDPDKRLTFRQLHKALNRLDKEIQVRVLNMNVPPGEDSRTKGAGMIVVSLRGVNFGFWSHLGCSGQNAIIFSLQGLV